MSRELRKKKECDKINTIFTQRFVRADRDIRGVKDGREYDSILYYIKRSNFVFCDYICSVSDLLWGIPYEAELYYGKPDAGG